MKKIAFCLFVFYSAAVFPQATAIIDSLTKLLPSVQGKAKVELLNNIAFNYFPVCTDSGFHYCDLEIELSTKINYSKGIADAKLLLSLNYYYTGQFKNALTSLMEALKIYENNGDLQGIGDAYSTFSYLYFDSGEIEKSWDYGLRSLKKYEEGKIEAVGKAYTYKILSDCCIAWNKFNEALDYLNKALALEQHLGDGPVGMPYTYQRMGVAYLGIGDLVKSKESFEAGLKIAELNRDPSCIAPLYVDYSQYFLKIKNYNAALGYIKKALNMSQNLTSPYLLPLLYKTQTECYYQTGDYRNAFLSQLTQNYLQDSISNSQRRLAMEEVQIRYAAEKKENEINLLKKEQELQSLWRNILIAAFIILLFISLFILRLYKQIVKTNGELKIARENADKANKLKTELLGIAAHDLRNPLASIIGFSDLALDETPKGTEMSEFLENINYSAVNMLSLVNKLLDSSAIEMGKIKLECKPVNISSLAHKINSEFSTAAANKKQKIIYSESGSNFFVNADALRLKEVLENLVSNAIKYSPYGKSIHIDLVRTNGSVNYSVRDEGPGLTDADKAKLFGRFQKLSARPTGGEASSGLGLSIAKQFIELQGGSIAVNSTLGEGATFSITLPAIAAGPEFEQHEKPEDAAEEIKFDKVTVLVADDIEGYRKVISELLNNLGLQVLTVSNGKEALESALANKPRLLFTDINMPEMDGYEVLSTFKKTNELLNIPVIAVTAEQKVKIISAGFDNHLQKPVSRQELINLLKNYLQPE